eukprot:scaffold12235_cov117-Isochrysis_galbana.AAC.7
MSQDRASRREVILGVKARPSHRIHTPTNGGCHPLTSSSCTSRPPLARIATPHLHGDGEGRTSGLKSARRNRDQYVDCWRYETSGRFGGRERPRLQGPSDLRTIRTIWLATHAPALVWPPRSVAIHSGSPLPVHVALSLPRNCDRSATPPREVSRARPSSAARGARRTARASHTSYVTQLLRVRRSAEHPAFGSHFQSSSSSSSKT